MKHHLFIIYDGISNSVFFGQVLTPLVQKISDSFDSAILASFESTQPRKSLLAHINQHKNIQLIILPKIKFVGQISLRYAAYHLNRALTQYRISSVTARGPLAGWIAAHTSALAAIPTIVQARGLAAQEYHYAHQKNNSWIAQKIVALRMHWYESIERYVYGNYAQQNHVAINAVSPALKQYLIARFNAPASKISLELADIPPKINRTTIQAWRSGIRKKLGIAATDQVYVYNGSAHPWQCPHETIHFFWTHYQTNKDLFLLVLTQEKKPFYALCCHYNLPSHRYLIISIHHTEMYHYLSAADVGMIFRKKHIINWVSRPTKILEYQAVGLPIVHNHTVALLTESTVG